MIITCDNCNTSFDLDDDKVKDSGSKVRCTNCNHVFMAHPPAGAGKSDAVEISDLDIDDVLEIEADGEEPGLVIELETEDAPEKSAPESEPEILLEENAEPGLTLEMESDEPSSDSLDMSDIEKMLDGDMSDERPDSDDEEPELALEADDGEEAEEDNLIEDELDLSDIEKLLEMDDDLESGEAETPDEVELTLEMDGASETTGNEDALTLEMEDQESGDLGDLALDLELEEDENLDLELEDSEDLVLDMDEDASETETNFDLDLDSDEEPIEEPAPQVQQPAAAKPAAVQKPAPVKDTFDMGAEAESEKEQKPQPKPEKAAPAFATSLPVPQKSRKAPVMILVILLILAGIGAGVWYYMTQKEMTSIGVKIGEISPLEDTFKYTFVDNAHIGKLFVVTGIVENKFDHNRNHILIAGELLAKGGTVVQRQKAYCGNVIREMELSTLDINGIDKRLSNMAGDNQANMNVNPGAKVPFMVVFANLPDDIEEYRIRIEGSDPAEK